MATRSRDRSISFGTEQKRPAFASSLVSKLDETKEEAGGNGLGLKRFGGFEDLVARRPQKEELVNRNILRAENISGSIQSAQEKLKKSILEDNLNQKVASRPTPEDLIANNILKDTNVAPSIRLQKQELEKARIHDKLNTVLRDRPAQED